ncbi:MAG: hypothetical protein GKS06_04195 [Acidobacteria bacterium]|nr:hypothetical protein [Acidobacteriota bacterium]
MTGQYFQPGVAEPQIFEDLSGVIGGLRAAQPSLVAASNDDLLELLADFGGRLLRDPATMRLDGVVFLAAWLKRANLEGMLELNLGGREAALEGFIPLGEGARGTRIAARPHGLVSMWMAGNVPTLAAFSFIPALLARNVCLVKLADPEAGMDRILDVLARSEGPGVSGRELADCVGVVWYSSEERDLSVEMSRAADAKVVWGGRGAIEGVRALPQADHCVNIDFGPKYSIGMIDAGIQQDSEQLDAAVAAFVRDIAIFDQRACSSPQTIFVERGELSLADVGDRFAAAFSKLPPKPDLDAYTTVQIVNTRAQWALDEVRDVIASADGANWTVCMDQEVSLKEAIQSRTVFLSAVDSSEHVIPLISPRVQTVGIAFGDPDKAAAFAAAATLKGAVRCVRPGLMNVQESPWDGKLLINQLVRWVTLKP